MVCAKRVRCASQVSVLSAAFPDIPASHFPVLKRPISWWITFPRSTAKPAGLRWRRATVNPAKCPAFLRPSWRSPGIGAGKPAVDADTSSREPSPMRFRLPCSTAPVSGHWRPASPSYQMLPAKRTGELLEAWCGVHPSTGTVMNLIREAGRRLEPSHRKIAETLLRQPVAGADETGVRAGGRLHWLHVLVTESLSWLSTHPKRGALAFEGLELLPRFQNILVHDGFKSYAKLECGHALCNAHLLRELTFQARHRQQDWAAEMIGLLCEALKTTRLSPQGLTRSQIEDFRSRHETKLREGWKLNPPDPPDAYPGPTPQTDTVNLLRRLQDGADEVLRFTRDPRVPFTNNEAEREVRMPKVKLKITGGFRTPAGAQAFCVVRSCLSTLKKQRHPLLTALQAAFSGADPLLALNI